MPIPVVKPVVESKIQMIEERTPPAPEQGISKTVAKTVESSRLKEVFKPKTDLEIVDNGTAFVFMIMMPEEVSLHYRHLDQRLG